MNLEMVALFSGESKSKTVKSAPGLEVLPSTGAIFGFS